MSAGVSALLGSCSWFTGALLPFIDAADYARLQCVRAKQAPQAWAYLAQRDFPRVDWPRLQAAVVYRHPASLYRVCAGDHMCLLCGEPLWGAKQPLEALIVVCRCAGLPRHSPYPYAHTRCADELHPPHPTGIATVRCRICERRRPAVPMRVY